MVDAATVARLLRALRETHAALEIDGLREFEYRTTYFDTPELLSYREALQRRRRRYKVRVRRYVDTDAVAVEVKLRGHRGRTVKHRLPAAETMGDEAVAFVRERVRGAYGREPALPVHPSLEMTFRRVTLVAAARGERVTCDAGVEFRTPDGATGRLDERIVIVETKSAHGRSLADSVLRGLGARPVRGCSKYCLGIGLTHAGVRRNALLPLLRRHFAAA
jgi:hypothetical protein